MAHTVFGIRHHGPGSSRSLVAALTALQPDAILVEGPPEADALLAHAARDDLTPPIALLVHEEDEPANAVFYPFALFSPEWQAIRYGAKHAVPVQFMDLPQAHRLARPREPHASGRDPLAALAAAAGYDDAERWWDHVVETRGGEHASAAALFAIFTAVRDALATLREADGELSPLEAQREAYMRQTIRATAKSGAARIAVVCGAWHAPALTDLPPASHDQTLLRGLPKVKTAAAWVPWSYDRLSFNSGYGAGVASPEWYHLLWEHPQAPVAQWMTRAARLLREKDLEASSASVIEAVRLASQLAALRDRAIPGLDELLESALAVLAGGHGVRLDLIARHLVVGTRLGHIPEDLPATPLARDLQQEVKRLRLVMSVEPKDLELDLRKDIDLDRSRLLHRLLALGVPWGSAPNQRARGKGTFREQWQLRWQPEFAVQLVEASRFGGSLADAATGKLIEAARAATSVAAISEHLRHALLAELPQAVADLLRRLADEAAVARDVGQMMNALAPLAETRRYGSVRQTDAELLDAILAGLVKRIVLGLPLACASLDDEAAGQMLERILACDQAIALLENADWRAEWRAVLAVLAEQADLHGLLAGATARLLHDAGTADNPTTARRMSLALSRASEPLAAAHWIQGFLSGGAHALLHDDALLAILDEWICALAPARFTESLPLLRRAFAAFPAAERRQIGERVKRASTTAAAAPVPGLAFDSARAARVLPVLRSIYGAASDAR